MRTFKRCVLSGVLLLSAMAAMTSAAQAGEIWGANNGLTLTSGTTRYNAALDVSCTGSTRTLAPGVVSDGTSVPPTLDVPVGLAYTGCSTSLGGATVNCRNIRLRLDAGGAPANTGQGGAIVPAYTSAPPASGSGCRIQTSTGCEIRVATAVAWAPVNVNDNAGPVTSATLTVTRTGVPFSTTGGLACLGVISGTAFYETPSGGNPVYTETNGGFSPRLDLQPNTEFFP